MAYWGYFDFLKAFIKETKIERPQILEIGVDKGQFFIPLLHFLSMEFNSFSITGCDIYYRDELLVKLELIKKNLKETQEFFCYCESSLTLLPKILNSPRDLLKSRTGLIESSDPNEKGLFDIILIDGDHNYYTVKKEFEYMPGLLKKGGLIIFDDYSGRWAEKDEYFSEFPLYEGNKLATPRQETEKRGVKLAVDEFLEENLEFTMTADMAPTEEPRVIYRSKELIINVTSPMI